MFKWQIAFTNFGLTFALPGHIFEQVSLCWSHRSPIDPVWSYQNSEILDHG